MKKKQEDFNYREAHEFLALHGFPERCRGMRTYKNCVSDNEYIKGIGALELAAERWNEMDDEDNDPPQFTRFGVGDDMVGIRNDGMLVRYISELKRWYPFNGLSKLAIITRYLFEYPEPSVIADSGLIKKEDYYEYLEEVKKQIDSGYISREESFIC